MLLDHIKSVEPDADRLELILAIAFRRRVPSRAFEQFMSAVESSRRGDQALANLRLALAKLSHVPDAHDLPERIAMADTLLTGGMPPDELLAALSLDRNSEAGFEKFDPDQPRVPAGNGPESGRWTAEFLSGAASLAMSTALEAAPILGEGFGALALCAATAAFGVLGFGTAFGLLVVPSPNSVSTSGPLPGNSGQTYSYDQPTGVLHVFDASGQLLAGGLRDRSGVIFDVDTGVPFARVLDGSIVFGATALAVARADEDALASPKAIARAEADSKEPKLCPEPGPDQPGSKSASARARAYQEQISRFINPHRPLEFGTVPALMNPSTGSLVHYDECDEKTGHMIEAKGPGFGDLLAVEPAKENFTREWLDQGRREVDAAGDRKVIWYFADTPAAAYARELFSKNDLGTIVVRVQPAEMR